MQFFLGHLVDSSWFWLLNGLVYNGFGDSNIRYCPTFLQLKTFPLLTLKLFMFAVFVQLQLDLRPEKQLRLAGGAAQQQPRPQRHLRAVPQPPAQPQVPQRRGDDQGAAHTDPHLPQEEHRGQGRRRRGGAPEEEGRGGEGRGGHHHHQRHRVRDGNLHGDGQRAAAEGLHLRGRERRQDPPRQESQTQGGLRSQDPVAQAQSACPHISRVRT